jgi:DNA repair and recombination protein RAD54B
MLSKPFKPPLLRRPDTSSQVNYIQHDGRPAKRRKLEEDFEEDESCQNSAKTAATSSLARSRAAVVSRMPLVTIQNPPSSEQHKSETTNGHEGYYIVLWRKYTAKKHKTWDGDGVLVVRGGYASLQDISGRDMGRTAFSDPLLPGSTLSIGGKDIEIDSMISQADFLAGKPFVKAGKVSTTATVVDASSKQLHMKTPIQISTTQDKPKGSLQAQMKAEMLKAKEESKKQLNVSAPKSAGMKTAFKNPLKNSTVMPQVPGEKPVPRHDPHAPGALVMKRPRLVPKDEQVVDVVLDPLLGKHLREHQRQGVAFLYECIMGLRDYGGEGCILADEMGLGKTLQTIALLWTLLKQNPIHNGEPVVKKALIVCPVTLINNWQKEFRKWLGNERIGVFVADGKRTRLTDFTMGKSYSVMIIGYERLRAVAEDLTKGAGIDIVIADEGHRLKTVQNKSAQAIQSLNTPRRIILSGTPIQNDLSEFYSMVNFVNDGLLGSYKQFMKNFENPIVKSRQPNALERDIELGESRSEELAQETSKFILRRTADILSKYLPAKTEYILFCDPTPTQANIYRHVLASPMFQCALGSSESALQLITILKKLCNSPALLSPKTAAVDETANSASIISLLETLPQNLLRTMGNQASAKLRILDTFLHTLASRTSEKIVLVSNYTSTLDLLQTLLSSLSLPFLRLDGSTPSSKRQGLVDDFNRSPASSAFAFLLSAKAGGMGLNLIGASRLVLFDVDWNPAVEEQAMARIHREGQKRHCKIYRFVMKGGIEERVWQRQVVKKGLAFSIMDGNGNGGGAGIGKKGVAQFSREELRDLFRLDERGGLRTHELVGCPCQGKGIVKPSTESEVRVSDDKNDTHKPLFVETAQCTSADETQCRTISASDDEDNESLPDLPTLVKASKLSTSHFEAQERAIASGTHPSLPRNKNKPPEAQGKGKEEMQGLMEYVHVDTATLPSTRRGSSTSTTFDRDRELEDVAKTQELIDDDILMDVLREYRDESAAGGISWVFKKTSGGGPTARDVVIGEEGVLSSPFFE